MRAALSLILILAAHIASAEPSRGCQASEALASGAHSLSFDGLDRRYLLDLPVEAQAAGPLLLALHGYTGSPEILGAPTTQAFVQTVTDMGWTLVRPASTVFEVNSGTISSWNDLAGSQSEGPAGPLCEVDADPYPCPPECGECGPCVWASCHDDVGFIEALIDELDEKTCFDRSRRFVLGHSSGGMMTHALTCKLPDLFAGGASIKGQPEIGFACNSEDTPSFIQITGALDRTVPPDGAVADDGFLYETSGHSAEVRANALECAQGPVVLSSPAAASLKCTHWDQCRGGKRIADCIDSGGGHEWPADADGGQWGIRVIFDFWAN